MASPQPLFDEPRGCLGSQKRMVVEIRIRAPVCVPARVYQHGPSGDVDGSKVRDINRSRPTCGTHDDPHHHHHRISRLQPRDKIRLADVEAVYER